MLNRLICLTSLFIAFVSNVHANQMELAISNDLVVATYESTYGNDFSMDFSLLHTDVEDADVEFNGDNAEFDIETNMLAVGFYANDTHNNVKTHLGGQVFWIDADIKDANNGDDSTHGIAVGGRVDVLITPEFVFSTNLLYAPDILTGGGFDNYTDLELRFSYQVLKNAGLFIGYRKVDLEAEDIEPEVYDGVLFGFRFDI